MLKMSATGDTDKVVPLAVVPALLAMLWVTIQPAQAEIVWHWEDRFSAAEKVKLTNWITKTSAAIEHLVAPFPFDIHINFYRAKRGNSPVPWANTVRSRRQGVNFHVNPEHELQAFFEDWTAPHELSHLLIPYVGRSNSWFAEGFASYMQYQVMRAMHILDYEDMQVRYRERIERAEGEYDLHHLPFTQAAGCLAARGQYPTMYWGAAVYFLQVDRALQKRGNAMLPVLRQFMDCCRLATQGFDNLVDALDRLASEPVFSEQLDVMKTRPGFPAYRGTWPEESAATSPHP